MRTTEMTLASYDAIKFQSQKEHESALYDACRLIVDTYGKTDLLDKLQPEYSCITACEFMQFARTIALTIELK